ncbi:MAG TPA: sensor histidine kinase [Bryobacteraceae bacterium]|nr:sensor histidine kinase [Bryobacteraceae bacterium]
MFVLCVGGHRLMPGISQKRFHTTIKGPAAEALELLSPHAGAILHAWSAALRDIGIGLDDVIAARSLDFASLGGALRASTFSSFRGAVRSVGERLARRGVRFEKSSAALNRLFEICVPYLDRPTAVLGFARMHALVSLLLAAGSTGEPLHGKPTLVEASLSEAEHRLRGEAAYVTRIYERERRALSHDLHDEIGHDLILLKLYLEMIVMSLRGRELPEIKPRLSEAITLVSHAIDSVRRLVLDLGPAVFDELGFLPAVKSYTGQFSARTKINVTVQEGYLPENVPQTHQVALYRLLQGALSNVLKHAHAKNVRVSLGSMKDSVLIMVVEDDGVGFDTSQRPGRRSFGLTAMRERVQVLGGRIHVESKRAGASGKKHGTRIEVDLPLTAPAEQK